jgi:MarR family transcriptional regulator, temperature-dependent positive regulator of motility
VRLTEEGRRVLRTAEPLARRIDERILDALPSQQRDQFMGTLASVVLALQKPTSA